MKNCGPVLQVVNESLNPTWNQTFDFVVEDGLHDLLILEVYDHDTFGKVSSFLTFLVVGCSNELHVCLQKLGYLLSFF